MNYQVKLFASLKESVGCDHWTLQTDQALKGSQLLTAFFNSFPALDGLRRVTRLAVNQAFCSEDPLLNESDEIALIPPLSQEVDMIEVTREPIDIAAMNASSGHHACGAVLTFSGTVRNHHLGRQVEKLAYEAYDGMAQKEMQKVAEACQLQWPEVKKIQAVHRFGEMPVGDSSIYITVASPHRPDGFAALRFMIDRIKRDVPIWKKEFYTDGETDWLHPEEGCCHNHLHLVEDNNN